MNTTTDTILQTTAKACAAEHLSQGWTSTGPAYDIGNFHGDREALIAALGRDATNNEIRSFEMMIQQILHSWRAA